MKIWDLFWNKWLLVPINLAEKYLGVKLPATWGPLACRIAVIVVAGFLLFEIYSRFRRWRDRRHWMDDMVEVSQTEPGLAKDPSFVQKLEGAKNLDATIKALKKDREYARMGEVYAAVKRHKDAAKWFGKAGERRQAAEEWARAGYTLKAAKLLMKEGDYATAGRFFEEKGKYVLAAQAYAKLGDSPSAASAYAKAGKHDLAAQTFITYFRETNDAPPAQVAAADACFTLLQDPAMTEKMDPESRRTLTAQVARRFEQSKRIDLAAQLFQQAGEMAHAGELYASLGKLELAARCMQEAGKTREAALIGAKYYESIQRWAEAGMAYAGAQEFRRAGDCFAKTNDYARAADAYAKGGEYYGAALALVHMKKTQEAIPLLQKVSESDKSFDVSRALLGRCFYELHDYAHCAATLDNHLLGKRVEHGNIEYFYMLALAYEQLGELAKSRDILYRIRTVDVEYRDVSQRLSSISSRISLGAEVARPAPIYSGAGDERSVMLTVENLLGGRYRLDRELGRGGMGTVYLARDTQLDRPVALKFLGSLVDDSDEYRQRFVREAKAAARVNHPNIVSIYDISANMGKAYIAMEFVEGESLNKRIKDAGTLPPREAVNMILQACSALDAIHQAGIIHRDIKPDNLLIAKGGLIKLTDFGLAKAENARITASNIIMGTPAYMSPEQTRDADVDARSDIYSLGLVLYEMLTGKSVFRGGDLLSRQQTEIPPNPGTLAEGIPPELDAIVMKCIEKKPEDRFQTAAELGAELRKLAK